MKLKNKKVNTVMTQRNERMYKKEEVIAASKEYFDGDSLAADVATKYLLRDEDGSFLEPTPDHMHRRLSRNFARAESKYPNPMTEEEIYQLFKNFGDVVPQGSPMSAIGNPYQLQSLSNCFVIDQPDDSYGGILFTDQEQVQIMKRRGGVGFDISKIRPKGATTSNAARTTDGIGIFMERFSNSCREVAQGGRRGALMQTLDCRHPEVETFINIKRDLSKVTGANITVRFTDDFMQAVEDDTSYTLRWPVDVSVEEAQITKVVSAKSVWNQFVDSAWTCAEPGASFWDTVKRSTPADIYSKYGFGSISTNPCVTGDTIVETNAGKKTVKELAENNASFKVVSYDIENKQVVEMHATAFKTKDNAKILQITTKSGKKIRLTPDHRVYTQRGWIEAGSLLKSDKILSIKCDNKSL